MKQTFTSTTTIKDLSKATFKLFISNKTKYEVDELDDCIKVEYKNIKAWSIITGEEAKEIESMTDASGVNENHEYLVLHFVDGSEGTFRNSHVVMFIR